MAVLVEGISVVGRKSAIAAKYPRGLEGFRSGIPNATFCEDDQLVRVGFISPDDARDYVGHLESDPSHVPLTQTRLGYAEVVEVINTVLETSRQHPHYAQLMGEIRKDLLLK